MKKNCSNCNTVLAGNYCSNCGQKSETERITFHYLLHDVTHSIFHIDKGFLYTLKQLFTRPAKSIREFLEGKRVNHFKPFAYLIILSAISSFAAHLGRLYNDSHSSQSIILHASDLNRMIVQFTDFFRIYQSVFYFIMIPLISLCTWTFFHKKYNYWEHFIINTFLTAQFNLLLIVAQIVILFNNGRVNFTPILIIFFTFICGVYGALFRTDESRFQYAVKAISLYIVVIVLYTTGLSFAGLMTPWWGI